MSSLPALRRNGLLRRAEAEREQAQQKLAATARQLASGFRKEKERFSRETEAAEARQGGRGTSIVGRVRERRRVVYVSSLVRVDSA